MALTHPLEADGQVVLVSFPIELSNGEPRCQRLLVSGYGTRVAESVPERYYRRMPLTDYLPADFLDLYEVHNYRHAAGFSLLDVSLNSPN